MGVKWKVLGYMYVCRVEHEIVFLPPCIYIYIYVWEVDVKAGEE